MVFTLAKDAKLSNILASGQYNHFDQIVASSDFFLKLGFTPCKAKQPLRGMELQEKIKAYSKSV